MSARAMHQQVMQYEMQDLRSRGGYRRCGGTGQPPGHPPRASALLSRTPGTSEGSLSSPGRRGSMALESEPELKAEQMKGLPSVNKLF